MKKTLFKVSKLLLNPTRTIGLENYSSVKLSAGLEIVFDTPAGIDSKELKEATNEARKFIRNEFIEQWKPFRKQKEEKKS